MNTAARKPKASPLVVALVVTMIILVAYLVFAFFSGTGNIGENRANIHSVKEMGTLASLYPALADKAGRGDAAAYEEIERLKGDMEKHWGNVQAALAKNGDKKIIGAYSLAWNETNKAISELINTRGTILFVDHVNTQFENNHAGLQVELNKVVDTLLSRRAAAKQVALAQAQLWRAERIRGSLQRLLSGGDVGATEQLTQDARLFSRVTDGFKNGDAALGITRLSGADTQTGLNNIEQLFNVIDRASDELAESASMLMKMHQSRDAVVNNSPVLVEQAARLADHVRALSLGGISYGPQAAVYVGIFLVIGLTLLGLIFYLGTRSRLQETAEANRINQDAILRLLDDIEGLGEGDLTAEISVTEGFTGAIADAINLTIVQLRELVSRIVDTADKVSASANETRSTVSQLTGLSEHQAEEIAGASAAINEMAITIDQVSANAAESAAVADRSVSIANKGAVVVRSTIAGMDNIRGQIQDTAKRIKRLGESSQEIGDIVSLINDIADQTNVLALNAAIQASMAGDAGRGFAVVADEVQRLAERSANATKQIAALVKTIQTDTNEAVSSMEQTTAEVVAGASLTEDAGIALSEIETVSTNLAELIQDISTAARHQSTTAGHISNTMNVIQDITSQTLDGTNRTASSVGELANMAIDQRESVSGFKLPDQGLSKMLNTDSLTSPAARGHVSWLDDRSARDEHETEAYAPATSPTPDPEPGFEDSQDQTPHEMAEQSNVAELAPNSEQAAGAPLQTPAHIKQVLEENSAAMDEIDYLSEMEATDEELAELDVALEPGSASFGVNLEAELAGIDLDEFDLEPENQSKNKP